LEIEKIPILLKESKNMSKDNDEKKPTREPFKELPASRDYATAPPEPLLADQEGRRLTVRKAKYELPPGKKALPKMNEAHAFILFNLTHRQQRPQSPFPGFRLLGAFPSQETMKAFIAKHYTDKEDCSLWVTPSHHLTPICTSTEKQTNMLHCQQQVQQLVQLYEKSAKDAEQQFTEAVEQQKVPEEKKEKSLWNRSREAETCEANQAPPEMVQLPKTSLLAQDVAVLNQRFAVVIVLRDLRDSVLVRTFDPEPAFAVLDVFEKEEDASFYAQYTATESYPLCSIDVVDMYEWLFPENIKSDEIKEVYADKTLDDIMAGRKDTMANAAEYERWCTETKNVPRGQDSSSSSSNVSKDANETSGK
jgi:hypothetical protein